MLDQLKNVCAGLIGPKGSVTNTHPITGEITQIPTGGVSGGKISVSHNHARFLYENLSGDLKKAFELNRNSRPKDSIMVEKATLVKAVGSVGKKPVETIIDPLEE